MATFSAFKLNLDNSLSNRENLGESELDLWMEQVYGKFASIVVVLDQTGQKVTYTDNGKCYVKV